MRCTDGSAVPSRRSPRSWAPREQVAQLVADLADREAEFGQPPLLAELVGQRPLHPGERLLGLPDLVRAAEGAMIRPASSGASAKAVTLVC